MKKSLFLSLSVFAVQSVSFAFLTVSASTSSCGPYPYKQDPKTGEIFNLPIFKDSDISKGYKISEEQQKLKAFVSEWAGFFEKNGEPEFKMRMYCYGHYDDGISTGPNALAYKDQAILIGTAFKAIIRDSVDEYIFQQLKNWNPDQKSQALKYSASAAFDFVQFHEYGHLLQKIHKYTFSGPTSKMTELNADCVGSFLQTIKQIQKTGTINMTDTLSANMYAYALGDGNLKDSNHHGYPNDRQAAYAEGLRLAINMKNKGIDLNKIQSKQIIEACRASYR
jgi:hypothetical protein